MAMTVFLKLSFLSVLISVINANALAQELQVGQAIAAAAIERTKVQVLYDPAYRQIEFPMGDVDDNRGVCSAVVIRSLRAIGVDLQALINADMREDFAAYPKQWGALQPDKNIDHRRVLNIETFFVRHNMAMPISDNPNEYAPGDIVAWNLRGHSGGQLAHIGIVSDQIAPSGAPYIIHNIGAGTEKEDVLFAWPLTGHYRVDVTALTEGA